MRMLQGRKLLTCRYWAFDRCPHEAADCLYAHWDTGRLSDYLEQRGTCWHWAHGKRCRYGNICVYEHRETGMMGQKDGQLFMRGLNLEIANAARKSGFNTWNLEALMDLIWAVRRVTFVHGISNPRPRQRPPKHPLYPDYYRPSDPLENAKSVRKRARNNDNSVGTALDDENRTPAEVNNSAKRQKVVAGQMGRHIVHPPRGPPNPVHPSQFPNRAAKTPLPRVSQPQPEPHQDATLQDLPKMLNMLFENGVATHNCGDTMEMLWEYDPRIRAHRELVSMLKFDIDHSENHSENGTTTAYKHIRELIEKIEDMKDDGGVYYD